MSKKKLLEEGTVRQFMKLANLKPLASDFITEKYAAYDDINEQEEDELEGEDEMPMDMGAEDEMPMDDMGMAPEEEGAAGVLADIPEEAVEALIDVVAGALEAATGVEIEVTGAEEGMEDELPPEAGEEMDFAPAAEIEGEEEEMALQEIDMIDEDAVMKETYRRVTKRLGSMNKQHKLVESVTNRIMSRLRKSK
jgi:hypothetical protein